MLIFVSSVVAGCFRNRWFTGNCALQVSSFFQYFSVFVHFQLDTNRISTTSNIKLLRSISRLRAKKQAKEWCAPQKEFVKFVIRDEPQPRKASFRLTRWSDPDIEKELALEPFDHVRITNKRAVNVVAVVDIMPEGEAVIF